MRPLMTCMKCFEENGSPPDLGVAEAELRGDGLYKVTCDRGHVSVVKTQEQHFEVLFDLGAMAFIDGYCREAIPIIAASLERFLEYYVRVISIEHGIATETVDLAWASISRQSERQLGAFLFTYLLQNKRPVNPWIYDSQPDLEGLSSGQTLTWSAFRNKIIHDGYIPSAQETLAYGDLVLRWINQLIDELRNSCAGSMSRVLGAHLRRRNDYPTSESIATMLIPTLINLTRAARHNGLEDALSDLEKYKRWLYHSA